MWIEASAPSNIALIKYMGKSEVKGNKATNSSFSYCLENLRTYVRIQKQADLTEDQWQAFQRSDLRPIQLSAKGLEKFLNHFQLLKREFKLEGHYLIQSANNFPSDCGLASSASSFAALTLAAYEVMLKSTETNRMSYRPKELAKLSQKGSGSSCRSFFSPWSLWHSEGAESIQIPYAQLKHIVLLCDESIKRVSSSEAHVQVLTSDLFKGRIERAEERLQKLINSMREQNWKQAFEICWNEFWDMHMLFHTSVPAFMYMNDKTVRALSALHNSWLKNGDGPLITMDAGSNIHLLFKIEQKSLYESTIQQFTDQMALWTDEGYRPQQQAQK